MTFFPPEPALYNFERYDANGRLLGPHQTHNNNGTTNGESNRAVGHAGHVEQPSSNKTAAEQLTERQADLRKRAIIRNGQDAQDEKDGVVYRITLDPRLTRPTARSNNTIEAIKIPSKNGVYLATLIYRVSDPTPATKTILFSHGNATDIGAMYALQANLVSNLGVNVVMYDYSGYGESGGVATEFSSYSDIKTIYEYTKQHVSKDPGNIILYGQSVGSGPSCKLAYKNNEIGGMILHSPFTSGMRVLTPSRILGCLDIYPNIDRIKLVRCPVMVIHGKLDEEVPFVHGVELHNAVPPEFQRDPWWINDRGHNDITEGSAELREYLSRIRRFIDSLEE